MIPAAFEYHAPSTIGEATALLQKLGEDAKVLSGGQSLIPLMKLRLASPAHLVDINGIPGLSGIREDGGFLKIGALPGAPVLRTDKKDKKDNHIWHWEWGNRSATDRAFGEAAVTIKEDIYLPRIHVASIETCGCVAHFDKIDGKLTVWMTTQAPHAIRTVFALVAGHG